MTLMKQFRNTIAVRIMQILYWILFINCFQYIVRKVFQKVFQKESVDREKTLENL